MADSRTAVDFTFAHLPEPWLVAVLLAVAVTAAWAGWRLYGPRAPGLAGNLSRLCRALAMAFLVLAIGGPALRRTETTVLSGTVVLAVDASASMARGDGPGGKPRFSIAQALSTRLAAEAERRRFRIETRLLAEGAPAADVPRLKPEASASVLGDGLLSAAQGRAEVLIAVTDGRSTAGTTLAAAGTRLRGRDLRVMLLAVGGERLDPELFIDEVAVNRECALDESEPVVVRLSHRALPAGPIITTLLVDGSEVDHLEMQPEAGDGAVLRTAEARLAAVFRKEGPARIAVRIEGGGIIRSQDLGVTVRERKLSVLLLDQRPRYEVRYLMEALRRDRGATVHAYLSDGRWQRWGGEGPERRPLSPADITAYDAVIWGDLGADAVPEAELTSLANHIRRGGAGLVLIPGETGAQAGLMRSPLAECLPAQYPDAVTLARGYQEQQPRQLRRTPLAEAQGLLDSGGTPWEQLPALLGAATLVPRPGADVLAVDGEGRPLVVARAAGAGRALVVGVDDTWRWRRGAGDRWLHRFHSQILRFAAAGRRAGAAAWRVVVNPRRAAPGEPVSLGLIPTGADDEIPESAALRLAGPEGVEVVVPLTRQGRGFSARITAPAPGTWTAGVAAGPSTRQVEPGELTVVPPEDERRDPRADRPALDACARACGGQVFDDPEALLKALPADLGKVETTANDRGLWDTWWALLLAVGLLGVDWAIRRRNRLP